MINLKLKQIREENGITQAELARKMGVAASTIGSYEQGIREPDHKNLVQLSRVLGVTVDRLLGADCCLSETIANNMKIMIESIGITQEELANKCGITSVTISRYVTKERTPHIENLIKIADYFNVSLDWLCGRTERR